MVCRSVIASRRGGREDLVDVMGADEGGRSDHRVPYGGGQATLYRPRSWLPSTKKSPISKRRSPSRSSKIPGSTSSRMDAFFASCPATSPPGSARNSFPGHAPLLSAAQRASRKTSSDTPCRSPSAGFDGPTPSLMPIIRSVGHRSAIPQSSSQTLSPTVTVVVSKSSAPSRRTTFSSNGSRGTAAPPPSLPTAHSRPTSSPMNGSIPSPSAVSSARTPIWRAHSISPRRKCRKA